MRDLYYDADFATQRIEHRRNARAKFMNRKAEQSQNGTAKLSPYNASTLNRVMFSDSLKILFYAYGRGDSRNSISDKFDQMSADFLVYSTESRPARGNYAPIKCRYLDGYWRFSTIVSIGILLGDKQDQLKLYFDKCWQQGQDFLLDWFAILANISQDIRLDESNRLHPTYNRYLYDAISLNQDDRSGSLALFLDTFYPKSKRLFWYNAHKDTPEIYFGYWRFDVAAIVKSLSLDDSAFRDNPFYPKDILSFGNPTSASSPPIFSKVDTASSKKTDVAGGQNPKQIEDLTQLTSQFSEQQKMIVQLGKVLGNGETADKVALLIDKSNKQINIEDELEFYGVEPEDELFYILVSVLIKQRLMFYYDGGEGLLELQFDNINDLFVFHGLAEISPEEASLIKNRQLEADSRELILADYFDLFDEFAKSRNRHMVNIFNGDTTFMGIAKADSLEWDKFTFFDDVQLYY